jgi:hypothetical protein
VKKEVTSDCFASFCRFLRRHDSLHFVLQISGAYIEIVNLKEMNDFVICRLKAFQLLLLHSGLRIFLLWFNERCQLCRVSLSLTQQCERRELLGTNTIKLGAYTIVHKGYQKNSPANKRNRNMFLCTHYMFWHHAPNVVRIILVICTCVGS